MEEESLTSTSKWNNRTGLPPKHSSTASQLFGLQFATSPFLRIRYFAALRCLFALWSCCVITISLTIQGIRDGTAGHTFSYFTYLTYWGILGYFVASAFHSVRYAVTGRVPLSTWPRPLQLAHTILYTTVVSFPVLVTVVFWTILSDKTTFATPFSSWQNISLHALNTFLSIIDAWILTSAPPPPLFHITFLITILLLYLSLAYLTQALQGWYPYDFLSSAPKPNGVGSHAMVAAYCVGITVAIVVVFFVSSFVLRVKEKWVKKRFGGVTRFERVSGEEEEERKGEGEEEVSMNDWGKGEAEKVLA